MTMDDAAAAWTIAERGRVAPRECVRAARDDLNAAFSSVDERVIVPRLLSALDWMRRALEQYPAGQRQEDET